MSVKIYGLDQLNKNLEKLVKATDKKHNGEILLDQAEKIRDRIKARAPTGPTGNLKRSPVAKLLKEKNDLPAIAIAGIDRKKAPHAHLVEFGTSRMSAKPFFRPAVDESKSSVMDGIKKGLKKNIEGAV